jgi:hypothetical protein
MEKLWSTGRVKAAEANGSPSEKKKAAGSSKN